MKTQPETHKYPGPDPATDGDIMDEAWQPHNNPSFEDVEFDDLPTQTENARGRSWLVGVVASLLVLGLLSLGLGHTFHLLTLPSLDFLKESRELGRDPFIQELRRAVVQLEVSGGGFNTNSRRGTGFNIAERGIIVTNRHVVEGASVIAATFREHGTYYATDWAVHPDADLAIVYLAGAELPTLSPVPRELPGIGDSVIVIGNPLGFTNTVMSGTIRSYARIPLYADRTPIPVMEIAAPIHEGSSGSPVFNQEGDVIGVIFARLPGTERTAGRGLAIPITEFERWRASFDVQAMEGSQD